MPLLQKSDIKNHFWLPTLPLTEGGVNVRSAIFRHCFRNKKFIFVSTIFIFFNIFSKLFFDIKKD